MGSVSRKHKHCEISRPRGAGKSIARFTSSRHAGGTCFRPNPSLATPFHKCCFSPLQDRIGSETVDRLFGSLLAIACISGSPYGNSRMRGNKAFEQLSAIIILVCVWVVYVSIGCRLCGVVHGRPEVRSTGIRPGKGRSGLGCGRCSVVVAHVSAAEQPLRSRRDLAGRVGTLNIDSGAKASVGRPLSGQIPVDRTSGLPWRTPIIDIL